MASKGAAADFGGSSIWQFVGLLAFAGEAVRAAGGVLLSLEIESGKILVAGGSKDVEIFDPASGKFLVAAGQIDDARHFMTETKLRDGSVLLAGGYPDDDQATSAAWIYKP